VSVILVSGDRDWPHGWEPIARALERYGASMVMHGAARGADLDAQEAAIRLEIPYFGVPARWSTEGKGAGIKRNQRMLESGRIDMVLACHDDLGRSKGTRDMIARAHRSRIKVVLLYHDRKGFHRTRLRPAER